MGNVLPLNQTTWPVARTNRVRKELHPGQKTRSRRPFRRRQAIRNSYIGIGSAYILAIDYYQQIILWPGDRIVAPVALLAPAIQGAQDGALRIDRIEVHIEAPQPCHVLEHFGCLLVQRAALELRVAQG